MTTGIGESQVTIPANTLQSNTEYVIVAVKQATNSQDAATLTTLIRTPFELSVTNFVGTPEEAVPERTDCSLSITSWTFDEGLNFEIWFIY